MKAPTYLILGTLFLPLFADPAHAVSWQWRNMPGRERVLIQLDAADQLVDVQREGTRHIIVRLNSPASIANPGTVPSASPLISGLSAQGNNLRVDLKSPAFGFVFQPTQNSVVLDIYPDTLGNRWRPNAQQAALEAEQAIGQETTQPAPAQTPFASPPAPAQTPFASPLLSPAALVPTANVAETATTALRPQAGVTVDANTSVLPPVQDPALAPAETPVQVNAEADPQAVPQTAGQVNTQIPPPTEGAEQNIPAVAPAVGTVSTQLPLAQNLSPETLPVQNRSEQTTPADNPQVAAPAVPEALTAAPEARAEASPASTSALVVPARQSADSPPDLLQNPSVPQVLPDNGQNLHLSSSLVSGRLFEGSPENSVLVKIPDEGQIPQAPNTASALALPNIAEGSSDSTASAIADFVPPPEDVAPQVRSSINLQGPESWSEENAIVQQKEPLPFVENAGASVPGADAVNAAGQTGTPGPVAPPEPVIVYKDEKGNVIDAPPDIPALTQEMRQMLQGGFYTEALPAMETLRKAQLSPEVREELLYGTMHSLNEVYKPDYAGEYYDEVVRAANEAMNFNPNSLRVPEALNVLSNVHLVKENIAEAEGYVQLLLRAYPQHQAVTGALLRLGELHMNNNRYADAEKVFQTILASYPESRTAKDAARLQATALFKQGLYDRALTLFDFIERRWPRVYLEDPEYLLMAATVQEEQGRFEGALNTYWLQYNLLPSAPTTPSTMMKIAQIYFELGKIQPAVTMWEELYKRFPHNPLAPEALLHIGEFEILSGNPSLDTLFDVFNKPNPRIPNLYYEKILAEYPDSEAAVAARLRSSVWDLWGSNYKQAMDEAKNFMTMYPDKQEYERGREILLRAFSHELGLALDEENYERILSLWEGYPEVQDFYQPLENNLRVALARAQLNRGNEQIGLDLLSPFLEGAEDPLYGMYTYNLYLASLLRREDWNGILQLGQKVAQWKLPQDIANQLDYSMALSAENINLPGRALPLWQKLAPNEGIPLYQRAYASYFLARDAERQQDLRNTYQYNLDALAMFTQLGDEGSAYADSERVRESVAALMDVTEMAGRIAEALEWASQYAQFVLIESPDYAGLRFREARLHRKLGDLARWRSILEEIVNREPESVFGKMAASELRTQDVARDLARFAPS